VPTLPNCGAIKKIFGLWGRTTKVIVMLVQISIKNTELPAFINIIEHLRSGMVDSVTVLDPAEATFVVSDREVVRERVAVAEKRGSYTDHETFWKNI